MPDDQVIDPSAGGDAPGDEAPKHDDRKVLIGDRDAAKKRARDAEKARDELAAKLAERQAADEAAQVEQERKKNDFAALEARLKKERDDLAKRVADAEARFAARERSDRETALVDAVSAKLGMANRTVIRGVLKTLAEGGFDTAPEALDEKTAADAAKHVREVLGDMLPPKAAGSPGTPGVNLTTKKPGEAPGTDPRKDRVREIAASLSRR